MGLLAGVNYDPGTAVNKVTTSRIAMTALDTTNLRVTFTVPSNGAVLVRMKGTLHGAVTWPEIFLGVLEGATVKARVAPLATHHVYSFSVAASSQVPTWTSFVVSGLTPGANLTWDAAYGVDILVASTGLKYGGPDNATTNDAFGGFVFEVWDAPDLISSILYDPTGGAVVTKSISSLLAMTALDTTNLRATFTAPSPTVLVRMKCVARATQNHAIHLGVLEGSTVKGRQSTMGGFIDHGGAWRSNHEAVFTIGGLTPGNSYSFDAAYGVEVVGAAGNAIIYGGPDDTTTDNAGGAFVYEIWNAEGRFPNFFAMM